MHEWRITKYDPAGRDAAGVYQRDEWTSVADVGRVIGGRLVTWEEVRAVEDAYVAAAVRFMQESQVTVLRAVDVEGPSPGRDPGLPWADLLYAGPPLRAGTMLDRPEVERAIRLNLRELQWCRLVAPRRFFLHFGWDYYMYLGSSRACPAAVAYARGLGLFVEPWPSPYRRR